MNTNTSDPSEVWAEIGRQLLRSELAEARAGVEDAFHRIEESLYGDYDGEGQYSGDLTEEDLRELRQALNHARRQVEERVAPVAGGEPWGSNVPQIPMGVLWELTDHPRAPGVDPQEYVEVEEIACD